jgi:Flp pilus assembly protein TadG
VVILRTNREAIIQDSETRTPWARFRFLTSRRESDSGAAMIEMAFILILLVMLLVGTVSAAVAFGRGNSIQNAAREASRFGATLPDAGTTTWFDDVRGVARSAASGDLDAAVPGQRICVAYIDQSNAATHQIESGGSASAPTGGTCFSDGRTDEARVQVTVQRDSEFQAIVFATDITLSAEAAARYER